LLHHWPALQLPENDLAGRQFLLMAMVTGTFPLGFTLKYVLTVSSYEIVVIIQIATGSHGRPMLQLATQRPVTHQQQQFQP
jgi:hypothetical protein